eukprot:gene6908-9460_t
MRSSSIGRLTKGFALGFTKSAINFKPCLLYIRLFSSWINETYLSLSFDSRISLLKQQLPTYEKLDNLVTAFSKQKHGVKIALQIRNDLHQSETKLLNSDRFDDSLRRWLGIVFSYDCLALRRITFDHSSGNILEKVAKGESVHRVRSLSELKRRLHDGRRCFALFHHCMPEDPVVFVHIALTNGLAHSISSLDQLKAEENPTHAMFYSINSPHVALSGLDLAPHLLKEVMEELRHSYPSIQVYSTLSPMPSFLKWMKKLSFEEKKLSFQIPSSLHQPGVEGDSLSQIKEAYCILTSNEINNNNKVVDPSGHSNLQSLVTWLGCYYIAMEKIKTIDSDSNKLLNNPY